MRSARLPAIAWQATLALLLAPVLVVMAGERNPAVQGKRPLAVSNLYEVRDVRDPQRSPDGSARDCRKVASGGPPIGNAE